MCSQFVWVMRKDWLDGVATIAADQCEATCGFVDAT